MPPKKSTSKPRSPRKKATKQDESASEDGFNSDALDDESVVDSEPETKKRKRASPTKRAVKPSRKRAKRDDDDDDDEVELPEGQEIVGRIVEAPKTGQVPAGQISQNTLNFLKQLLDPECNDRDWFKLHDPVFRQAEKEWKDFVETFTEENLIKVDPQIPPLPPKDVIHRIYRDVRFSNDKTPYKKNLSASFSRSGRKGIFAVLQPNGHTMLAAGSYCPGKNELATIRANILRDPQRLRDIISAPEFVKFFGKPSPDPKGGPRNIFGREDELKTAPKGIDKTHKDIDLLKCRTFAVVYRFLDSEVIAPDFRDKLEEVARVVQPFVHCLNDYLTIQAGNDDDESEDDE